MLSVNFDRLPIWANSLVVVLTILVIAKGAHWLVESASQIAKRLGISELVIGLTVVALGTSAPEFAVTISSAYKGQGNISVGNIVGSNIFNLGFILGGAAMFRSIPTNRLLLIRDGTLLMAASTLLMVLIGVDLRLDRTDGLILISLLIAYLLLLFYQRRAGVEPMDETGSHLAEQGYSLATTLALLLFGLLCVTGGSHYMVDAATAVARRLGVSEWVIGVTIVAAGTSAPELATTLTGILKNRYDISAGNLIGSDLFNLLGVLGLAGVLRPVGVAVEARLSIAALMGMVAMVLIFMRSGWRISRLEGFALVLVAMARWVADFALRATP
ncbi:MAG: calcium/sodium antiporter [Deltaproteobacteria bacterium]|nr:calcium/sodium antiporter [Deltaproteobacteria bacterium]